MAYYTYLLRCTDGSLYAGIASDLPRRMKQHFSGDGKAAKYTRSHPPEALCAAWESDGRGEASRLEYRIKQLSKPEKERLACGVPLSSVFDGEFAAVYRETDREFLISCTPRSE